MKSFTAIITLLLAPTIFVAAAPAGDINTARKLRATWMNSMFL